ncbi:MAG: hypothetical protein ACFFCW_28845, partial [Candidatus Hodarchaeota archaeon]
MKTKEKKIKAWLEFLQANLDDLTLDKKISLFYGIYEDVVLNWAFLRQESPDSHEPIDSLEEFRGVLKIVAESEWEKFLLEKVQSQFWSDVQIETKKYLEEILLGPSNPIGMTVHEVLFQS